MERKSFRKNGKIKIFARVVYEKAFLR
jgi:hypothetical protein